MFPKQGGNGEEQVVRSKKMLWGSADHAGALVFTLSIMESIAGFEQGSDI